MLVEMEKCACVLNLRVSPKLKPLTYFELIKVDGITKLTMHFTLNLQ